MILEVCRETVRESGPFGPVSVAEAGRLSVLITRPALASEKTALCRRSLTQLDLPRGPSDGILSRLNLLVSVAPLVKIPLSLLGRERSAVLKSLLSDSMYDGGFSPSAMFPGSPSIGVTW